MCKKINCWQFVNCGREKGGLMVPYLGECPVQNSMKYDGLNEGVGAGRACWMVQDATCILKATGQISACFDCKFYKRVVFEEDEKVHFKYSSIPA